MRTASILAIALTTTFATSAGAATLSGDGFVGVVGTAFGDTNSGAIGPNSGAGSITNTTDGDVGTTADSFSGGTDFDYVGMQFSPAQSDVRTVLVTFRDFADGGWFNSTVTPPKVQVAGVAFPTVADGLFISNGDGIWSDAASTSDYPTTISDSDLAGGNAAGNTDGFTYAWSLSSPASGVHGIRVLGDGGGGAGGDGFIGIREIRVSSGEVLADLTADYSEAGTASNIPATASGEWFYHSDTNAAPTDGGLASLTFSGVGLEGGDGFGGTGSVFSGCCGPMPVISDDGLFDGFTSPPDGTLATHPGGSGGTHVAPEFLVLEYRATEPLVNLLVTAGLSNPSVGGNGIGWQLIDTNGTILDSGGANSGSDAGIVEIAGLAAGESIYLVIDNALGSDDPGGDQTFARFTVVGTAVPEPSTLLLLLGIGCAGLACRRRR